MSSSTRGDDESGTSFVDPEGTVRWRTDGGLPEGSVVPATAKVAVLTTGASDGAHDLSTGMRRWTAPAAEAGTPVLSTEAAVATTEHQQDGRHVVARDPLTGRILWERTGTVAGPAGPSALLVRGTGDEPGAETVSALDAATGDVLWVLPVTSGAPTSATIPASDAAPAATLRGRRAVASDGRVRVTAHPVERTHQPEVHARPAIPDVRRGLVSQPVGTVRG